MQPKYYNFKTGKPIKPTKVIAWKYRNKIYAGLETFEVEGKKIYYLIDAFGVRATPMFFDKSRFKKVVVTKEKDDDNKIKIPIQKPKNRISISSQCNICRFDVIEIPLDDKNKKWSREKIVILSSTESRILRELQLKKGDKVKITIEKVKK